MTLLIPHRKNGVPGWWRDLENDGNRIWLRCPEGHVGRLDDHTIRDDGTVHPSVQCPDPDCDWHLTIILGGWTPTTTQPESSSSTPT